MEPRLIVIRLRRQRGNVTCSVVLHNIATAEKMPPPDITMLATAVEVPVESQGILQTNGHSFMSASKPLATMPPQSPKKSAPLTTASPAAVAAKNSGLVTSSTTVQNGYHHHQSNGYHVPPPKLHPKLVWPKADAVCFDVDSTVCPDEAIDELAKFKHCYEQVSKLTLKAMGGGMTFREALTERLNIIRPSLDDVSQFLDQHPPRLTTGIKELVRELQKRDIPVYLVTGGFRRLVEPVAHLLNIPTDHVFANDLLFDPHDGSYAGFDHAQPTSDTHGKTLVCSVLKRRFGYRRLVMVGDGATDAETVLGGGGAVDGDDDALGPGADAFIGFGGNIVRPGVQSQSLWFVHRFDELVQALGPLG